jgi:predicted Zn-dependent protease
MEPTEMLDQQRSDGRLLKIAVVAFLTVTASVAVAQTRITPPDNKYTPAQDVELGQQAAKEVEQQLPLLRNDGIESLVDRIGRRLVQVTPSEMRHREFRYSFKVINVREINAFALPGGPMYVNRGMIQAAAVEGEVAGVVAHELSHVILRHGTAGATKQQPFAIGAMAGAIAGAIIGGNVGQVVAQGTQFGLGAYFLRYSREYEKQADLLGVQLMARAGYNPRDLVHMFQTIEKQGGGSGPQFLSDHPNPGNREAYITQEASHLRIEGQAGNAREFARVQDRLRSMPPAPTTEEVTRRSTQTTPTQGRSNHKPSTPGPGRMQTTRGMR